MFNFYKKCKVFIYFKSQYSFLSLFSLTHSLNSILLSQSHFHQFLAYPSSIAFFKYIPLFFLTPKAAHTIYNAFISCILHKILEIPPYQLKEIFLILLTALCYPIVWKYHCFSTLTRHVTNLLLL